MRRNWKSALNITDVEPHHPPHLQDFLLIPYFIPMSSQNDASAMHSDDAVIVDVNIDIPIFGEQTGAEGPSQPATQPAFSPGRLAQLYDVLPLDQDRCIRLLELDPPCNKHPDSPDGGPLTGCLRVVPFSTCPQFTALSYVWGAKAEPVADILSLRAVDAQVPEFSNDSNEVNASSNIGNGTGRTDVAIEITRNCRDALVSLRSKFGARGLCIWVDAICINQADLSERSAQVLQMEEVYLRATPVYVWLGHGNEQSDRAFQFLNHRSRFGQFMRVVKMGQTRRFWQKVFAIAKILAVDTLDYLRATLDYFRAPLEFLSIIHWSMTWSSTSLDETHGEY